MNNLLEKLKKLRPIWGKYSKYVYVCGLFVAMLLVMYFFTGEEYIANRVAQMNNKEVSGEDYVPDKEFEVDAYEAVNELICTYFDAYVNADFETLEEIATPVSDMEKSYIGTICQFYEEYQNVVCYTKHGLSKNSYIVSACFDIKFVDVDVVAPSMLLFYVQTNEDGELYINNLYSDFNMQYSELAINRDVFTALRKYSTQDDYLALYNNTETAFNQLIKENEEVYIMTKRTIPAMRQEWEDTVYYLYEEDTSETEDEADVTEATETTVTESVEPETETTIETEPESEEPATIYVKVNKNDINVRSEASSNSTKLGQVDKGTVLEKLGEENGWVKVKYDDQIGYISSNYVDEVTE